MGVNFTFGYFCAVIASLIVGRQGAFVGRETAVISVSSVYLLMVTMQLKIRALGLVSPAMSKEVDLLKLVKVSKFKIFLVYVFHDLLKKKQWIFLNVYYDVSYLHLHSEHKCWRKPQQLERSAYYKNFHVDSPSCPQVHMSYGLLQFGNS